MPAGGENNKLNLNFQIDINYSTSKSDWSTLKSVDLWAHEALLHGTIKENKYFKGENLLNIDNNEHYYKAVRESVYYNDIRGILWKTRNDIGSNISWEAIWNKIIFHGHDR